jgi:hypothetical protein
LPEWQQEFLKADVNEHASTWEESISNAEALETAELALDERAPAKRNIKEGEITAPTSKLPPKKKAKKEEKAPFCCKSHGSGQGGGLQISSIHANVHDQSESCPSFSDQLARPDDVILVGEVECSVDTQKAKHLKCFALCFPILS